MAKLDLSKFLVYSDKNKKNQSVVSISNSSGRIGFSEYACVSMGLKNCKSAILMWNPEQRVIAIKFLQENDSEGALRIQRRTSGIYLCADRFLKKFDIKLNKTTVYEPEKQEIKGVIYVMIDLNKPIKESNR